MFLPRPWIPLNLPIFRANRKPFILHAVGVPRWGSVLRVLCHSDGELVCTLGNQLSSHSGEAVMVHLGTRNVGKSAGPTSSLILKIATRPPIRKIVQCLVMNLRALLLHASIHSLAVLDSASQVDNLGTFIGTALLLPLQRSALVASRAAAASLASPSILFNQVQS